jgi:hypothetical protein
MLRLLIAGVIAIAGCGGARGTVVVRVLASEPVKGVARLHLEVKQGGQTAAADVNVTPARDLAPGVPLRLALVFPADRKGAFTIEVEARATDGTRLARGTASGDQQPGTQSEIAVLLGGAAPPGDMTPTADLVGATDGGVDATPPDLAQPADLATTPDLAAQDVAIVPDLAVPPDLSTVRDLSVAPDLVIAPDLVEAADLSMVPDLVAAADLTTD